MFECVAQADVAVEFDKSQSQNVEQERRNLNNCTAFAGRKEEGIIARTLSWLWFLVKTIQVIGRVWKEEEEECMHLRHSYMLGVYACSPPFLLLDHKWPSILYCCSTTLETRAMRMMYHVFLRTPIDLSKSSVNPEFSLMLLRRRTRCLWQNNVHPRIPLRRRRFQTRGGFLNLSKERRGQKVMLSELSCFESKYSEKIEKCVKRKTLHPRVFYILLQDVYIIPPTSVMCSCP